MEGFFSWNQRLVNFIGLVLALFFMGFYTIFTCSFSIAGDPSAKARDPLPSKAPSSFCQLAVQRSRRVPEALWLSLSMASPPSSGVETKQQKNSFFAGLKEKLHSFSGVQKRLFRSPKPTSRALFETLGWESDVIHGWGQDRQSRVDLNEPERGWWTGKIGHPCIVCS